MGIAMTTIKLWVLKRPQLFCGDIALVLLWLYNPTMIVVIIAVFVICNNHANNCLVR